jgi:PAS domain S-box-containing protein
MHGGKKKPQQFRCVQCNEVRKLHAYRKHFMLVKEKLELLHQKMISEIQDYAIILLDIDGTILNWNKGVEKIKGYKENEIIGQNFRIFYLPSDRQALLPEKLLDLAKKEGRARHVGKRVRKDGTTFWGSILITAIHDDDNNVIGFTKLTRELRDNELE